MNLAINAGIEFKNLGIDFGNLPKTFSVFGVDIAFYGLIIAIGMIAGIAIACYDAKKSGQDPNKYIDFAIYAIVFSVIGARLYYVAFSWDYYSKHLSEIINIREGGLAIYGGVIAGVLTCIIYTRIKKMSFTQVADTAVLGLITGQIIGRWGNFFNREAFGKAVSDNYLFGMRIHFNNNYSVGQVPDAVANAMEKMYNKSLSQIGFVQVQPTFLFESVGNLILLILMFIFRKKKKYNGEVLLWYLSGYGIIRFFIEGLRTDQLIMPVTGWPVSQFLSVVLAVVSIIIVVVKRIRIKNINAI